MGFLGPFFPRQGRYYGDLETNSFDHRVGRDFDRSGWQVCTPNLALLAKYWSLGAIAKPGYRTRNR